MLVISDIVGDTYKQFIKFAYQRSDACMVVLRKHRAKIFRQEDWLKNFPQYIPDEETLNRYAIMERESEQDIKLYHTKCLTFMQHLEPFRIKTRHDGMWPSTAVCCPVGEDNLDINLYTLKPEILPYLLEPCSYTNWMYPLYPEDLSFFKNQHCWAYSSSHEKYIEIVLDRPDEYAYLSDIGIRFKVTNPQDAYTLDQKVERFFEEY